MVSAFPKCILYILMYNLLILNGKVFWLWRKNEKYEEWQTFTFQGLTRVGGKGRARPQLQTDQMGGKSENQYLQKSGGEGVNPSNPLIFSLRKGIISTIRVLIGLPLKISFYDILLLEKPCSLVRPLFYPI